jgi:preprotein translocase subunit SecA
VRRIPRRLPCRREIYPTRAFADAGRKWSAIADEVQQCHRTGRPVLVGTPTIADSEQLADILRQHGLTFQLLNGRQDAEEAAIVAQAGRRGAITIATNLAGRGTDIRLEDGVADLGGLHVVVAEPHELSRIDRQLIGRGARQGDPGSARTYVSAEDSLIQFHGPWLIRPLGRCVRRDGEVPIDLSSRIRGIQRAVQRRQAAVRMAMMRRDLARDSLLSQLESV